MTNAAKIECALEVLADFGQIDGEHHKAWVIDQVVRALLGNPGNTSPEYEAWVRDYMEGEDGPETFVWHTGIAP